MSTPVIDVQGQATPPALPAARPAAGPPKSPGLAFILSLLFPGVGQIYNGQPAKALGFFFAFVSTIYAVVEINPMPFALFIPFVILYNLVDAWRTATLINTRGTTEAPEEEMAESPAWGGGLIVLGTLFLFHNLGWLDLSRLSRFWPALLIVVGAVILYRSIQKGKGAEKGDDTAI
jgi:TM2 domain-containing membrane protein YozV